MMRYCRRSMAQRNFWSKVCMNWNPVDYRIWGVQESVYKTPVRDISDLKLCLIETWPRVHKTSTKLVINGEKRLRVREKAKGHHFGHLIMWNVFFKATTLHNRLFSEPPTIYRGKHVTLRVIFRRYYQWRRSVVKSEGVRVTQVKPSN